MPQVADYWTALAPTFDAEPDHGLRSPVVRAAWAARLREWVPGTGADVVDVGCGTGSLSLLLAEQGHRVVGVDASTGMLAQARQKFADAGHDVPFLQADAAAIPVRPGRFDVVLARHVLWALPDPVAALRHWVRLLRPGGWLVLIEGRWAAGDGSTPWSGGVPADVLTAAVAPLVARVHNELLADARLWGKEIRDERYVLLAGR
ncbi:MAG TPA: class I SAM-dependent methyltransferase [Pseudonocardiaceae bacterium]|nr:class I SAM-dependent methyltransferase [Pseudonocardiaceae bacterium]